MHKKRNVVIGLILAGALALMAATSGNIRWTQLATGARHGTDAYGQSSDGTGTNGNVAKYDASGGVTDGGVAASAITQTICSGTLSLGTSLIASGAAATTVTATCTGLASTDNISLDFNGSPLAVTGYVPSASGILTIIKWPSTNTINAAVVNNTGSGVTPGAITLNYRVTR